MKRPGVSITTWLILYHRLAGIDLTRVSGLSIGIGDPGRSVPGGTGKIYIDDIGFGHPLSFD